MGTALFILFYLYWESTSKAITAFYYLEKIHFKMNVPKWKQFLFKWAPILNGWFVFKLYRNTRLEKSQRGLEIYISWPPVIKENE